MWRTCWRRRKRSRPISLHRLGRQALHCEGRVLYTRLYMIYGPIYETLMRSTVVDTLPPKVKRALSKLGADIRLARRKRSVTTMMMAERLGVAKSTYLKIENGNPPVAMGAYAIELFVLGFAPE